jgi:hypothetical protein
MGSKGISEPEADCGQPQPQPRRPLQELQLPEEEQDFEAGRSFEPPSPAKPVTFLCVFFAPQEGQGIGSLARLAGRISSKVSPHFWHVNS